MVRILLYSSTNVNHIAVKTYIQFFLKQFTVRGSQFFLKMCPPFVSLVVSALFRHVALLFMVCRCWCPPFSAGHVAFLFICNISTHLSPRSVTGDVRPFPLAMQRFYSFVSQAVTAVRPFPLAM